MNKPRYLIVHHTGGTESDPTADTSHHTFEQVNAWHKALWNFKSTMGFYIGYHYYIERDGVVKQGRADTEEGAHTYGMNNSSIGICLAGNFDAYHPTYEQEKTLEKLLMNLSAKYGIPVVNVVPHRTFARKSCYGGLVGDMWARNLLARAIGKKITLLQELVAKLILTLERHKNKGLRALDRDEPEYLPDNLLEYGQL